MIEVCNKSNICPSLTGSNTLSQDMLYILLICLFILQGFSDTFLQIYCYMKVIVQSVLNLSAERYICTSASTKTHQ